MKLSNQAIIPQNGNSPKMTSKKKTDDLLINSSLAKLAVNL